MVRKDVSTPKGAQSAYMLWLQANRRYLTQEGESAAQTAKKAGPIWRNLSEEKKKVWFDKAKADKERFNREMQIWMRRATVANLTDDLLLLVFKYFPSVCEKFRLAAVSQQFRRCAFKDLKTPRPLVIDFAEGQLAGHSIPMVKWPLAVQLLAAKAQFSKIAITITQFSRSMPAWGVLSICVLRAVIAHDCLGALTRLEHDMVTRQDLSLVTQIIADAPKLSVVDCKLSIRSGLITSLSQALTNKNMEELTLKLSFAVPNEQLIELLHAIKPNTLKKVSLLSEKMLEGNGVFSSLANDTLSAVESMDYYGQLSTALIGTLSKLPSLNKVTFPLLSSSTDFPQTAVLADCIVSHFKIMADRPVDKVIQMEFIGPKKMRVCGCLLIRLITQVQREVQGISLQMETAIWASSGCWLENPRVTVKFTSANCSVIVSAMKCVSCFNLQCNGFYPNLLYTILRRISFMQEGHLHDSFLPKCKLGCVVDDLNNAARNNRYISFLFAELDEDGIVTITYQRGRQYFIDVPIGKCFNHACLTCWAV